MPRLLPLLVLVFSTLALAQGQPDPADLQRLNAAIARVQADMANTRTERSAMRTELQASEQAIATIAQQIDAIDSEIAAETASLDALRMQQQELETSRSQQQELIGAYLQSAWIAGNEEYLKLMLNQQDPQATARMLQYYRYFNAARAGKIAAYNQTLTELASVEELLAASTLQLQVRQQDLAVQKNSLTANQEQRAAALASLDSLLATRGEELLQLEDEKIELQILLQELQQSIANVDVGDDQEPIGDRKGKLVWPLTGRLVNAFGTRHNLGDLTWEGITIAGAAGADIRAVHHGRVVFADWFSSSGLLLIIDHGGGYMSLYAHNQELYKAVGDWVAGGEVIAAAGNTGGQRDPGLYFEIRRNGKAENPVNWLVAVQ